MSTDLEREAKPTRISVSWTEGERTGAAEVTYTDGSNWEGAVSCASWQGLVDWAREAWEGSEHDG